MDTVLLLLASDNLLQTVCRLSENLDRIVNNHIIIITGITSSSIGWTFVVTL
jgi:hypothetical protein